MGLTRATLVLLFVSLAVSLAYVDAGSRGNRPSTFNCLTSSGNDTCPEDQFCRCTPSGGQCKNRRGEGAFCFHNDPDADGLNARQDDCLFERRCSANTVCLSDGAPAVDKIGKCECLPGYRSDTSKGIVGGNECLELVKCDATSTTEPFGTGTGEVTLSHYIDRSIAYVFAQTDTLDFAGGDLMNCDKSDGLDILYQRNSVDPCTIKVQYFFQITGLGTLITLQNTCDDDLPNGQYIITSIDAACNDTFIQTTDLIVNKLKTDGNNICNNFVGSSTNDVWYAGFGLAASVGVVAVAGALFVRRRRASSSSSSSGARSGAASGASRRGLNRNDTLSSQASGVPMVVYGDHGRQSSATAAENIME